MKAGRAAGKLFQWMYALEVWRGMWMATEKGLRDCEGTSVYCCFSWV